MNIINSSLKILVFINTIPLFAIKDLAPTPVASVIRANKIYRNDLLDSLNESNNEKIFLSLLKPKFLVEELKKNYNNPEFFLNTQINLIYNNLNLISLTNLVEIFGRENINIQTESNSEIFIEINTQNTHKYNREQTIMNPKGLPVENSLYATKPNQQKQLIKISNITPRVLNIASGSNPDKKIYAVNIDIATIGKPEFICDAQDLSIFPDSYFTIVRASHILEHFKPEEIENILKEWTRVLHESGELHIAVPDAKIVIDELESGEVKNTKKPSLDFLNTTATIAQLYGVGYEDSKTDPRWRHRILFNYKLISWYLRKVGMEIIETMPANTDFAGACGTKDDSQNHYSLIVRARKKPKPHEICKPLSKQECIDILKNFKNTHSQEELPPLSVIIPVHNEEAILKVFLKKLLESDLCINDLFKREYIIVCNAITDKSIEIINEFINKTPILNLRVICSAPGILNAFHEGIGSRTFNGFVSKIDADCIIENYSIALLYINLFNNNNIQVTYAEPIPVGNENEFNVLQYKQWLRSKRLYIHGRCSMYRINPFNLFNFDIIKKSGCKVEDIILSYCYAFYCGLDSIKCTNHAVIYSTPVDNKQDFEKKILRIKHEITLIEKSFPYFIPIRSVLDRRILCPNKQNLQIKNIDSLLNLYETLQQKTSLNHLDHDWSRLESTKKLAITTIY